MSSSSNYDFIIISHSEVVHYEKYRQMPLDRIDLFRNLVQLRMIYEDGGFVSHLDVLNKIVYGKCFDEAMDAERRKMFSVWNLPSFNGMLAINQLVENNFSCKVINNFDAELDLIRKFAAKSDRPIIGISSTFILQWLEVGRISSILREIAPNAILVLGGAFVNDQFITKGKSSFERYLKKYKLDHIVYSFNSEVDLLQLMRVLRDGGDFQSVNNHAYMDSSGQFQTTKDVWNEPIVNYPAQSWSKLYSAENMGNTLQLRTTSGCPFSCAFCTYPVTAGGFTSSDVETFKLQLDAIDALGVIDRIIIIDDTPNVPLARFKKIVEILKQYKFRWHSFLRVQYMDDQLAADMAESGCDGVYLGIESANDTVLTSMNKKVKVADYRRGIAQLKQVGITTFAAFVLGFPGETKETIDDNIRFIEETGLEFYSLKEFYYMHTAPIHNKREEWNLVGHGNMWSHKTMSSDEASMHKLRMFEEVKGAVHIDSDSGLWYLAYLRECGFAWFFSTYRDIQFQAADGVTHADVFAKAQNEVDRLRDLWQAVRKHSSALVVQNNADLPAERVFGNFEASSAATHSYFLRSFNQELGRGIEPGITIFDLEYVSSLFGKRHWVDERHWYQSKHAFNMNANSLVAFHGAKLISAAKGNAKKCLVLDLDNTLWGGVIGDDGLGGIRLGTGAEGEAFVAFQEYILGLKRRGIILAVCSKNDEVNAKEVFRKHPDMRLKLEDIAVFVANWNNKADNIRQLAETLEIGLDSIVFVDDNPVERGLVRQMIPTVAVPEIPEDPAGYVRALDSQRYFETVAFSEEDMRRGQMYRENAERRILRERVTDLSDYLKGLEMQAVAKDFDEFHLPRISQLINKSNQFHLTTTRYSEADLRTIMAQPNCFGRYYKLKDRFGDNGLISVVILKRLGENPSNASFNEFLVDTWLMSCRVLARGMEQFVQNDILRLAQESGAKKVFGKYIPTPKNKLVLNHYRDMKYEFVSEDNGTTLWRLDVKDARPFDIFIEPIHSYE